MAEALNEDERPLEIEDIVLRTPGLQGEVEIHRPITGSMRSLRDADQSTPALTGALQNARTIETMSIVLTNTAEVPGFDGDARRDRNEEPAIEVTIPAPGDFYGQFILATDEAGLISWHFPVTIENRIDATRGAATRTYVIPRRVVYAAESVEVRGIVSSVAKKVLKVIVFPLIDPFIGEVGANYAAKWESHNRPYGVRTFTPGNYTNSVGEIIGAKGWAALTGKPSLLFIHGTFSRAASAFSSLDRQTMET